jgi:hypothetical protein
MTDDGELLVTQSAHQLDDVRGHRPVAVDLVTGVGLRFGRTPVSAKIRTDHAEPGIRQPRRNPMPGRVRSGVSVQQHHPWPVSARPAVQSHSRVELEMPLVETAEEHRPSQTHRASYRPSHLPARDFSVRAGELARERRTCARL